MFKRLELYGHAFAEMMSTPMNVRTQTVMDHDACLYYMINGRGEIYSPTEKVSIKAKESVLMKCGNYVGCVLDATPVDMHESIGFHFHPEVVQKLVAAGKLTFNKPEDRPDASAVKFNSSPELESYVQGILFYFDHPEYVTEQMIELKVQELLLILIKDGEEHPLVTSILSRLYKKEEVEFDKVIEANLYNNLSIPELALLTHRSESTFKRDFKKYYQQSPAKYFRNKRLDKAAGLLKSSELPVSEVAWECGFESPAHFSKTFFDRFNEWPRDFRQLSHSNSTA